MEEFFQSILDAQGFIPHALNFQSYSDTLLLLVMIDIVSILAKIAITVSLLIFFKKNKERRFGGVILLFGILMSADVFLQLNHMVSGSGEHQVSTLVVIVKGGAIILAVITVVLIWLKGASVLKGLFSNNYEEMIATANAPVFGVDLDGRITEWNKSAERLTGYSN